MTYKRHLKTALTRYVCQRTGIIALFLIANLLLPPGPGWGEGAAYAAEFRVGLENAPKTLDPRYATDAYGMRITQHLIFDTLVTLGYDLQIEPSLATRWETPDDTTYIFHLKDGVTFHDGTPFTAEDVKFTFEHLMDETTKSPFAGTYKGKISRIEVLDPKTIKFVLTQPVASFLTSIILPVLPRHIIEGGQDFPTTLIGTGPFKFVSQSPTDLRFEANKKYWEDPPGCDRIIFKVVKDENTRFLKMKKEEIDLLVNALSSDKIKFFASGALHKAYQVIEEPGISYNYLAFNMADEKMKDNTLRQAIAHGIDVDEIIKYKLAGHAIRARGLLSPVNWFSEPDVPVMVYDPEKARQLLDKAGYKDPDGDGPRTRLTVEMKTSNNAEITAIARIIQAQLLKIGIHMDLKSYEWGTFYGDIKSGNFQMTSMRWVGVTEPDFYYDLFHSSQVPPAGRNRGRYINARVDDLVQQGRVTLDPDARKRIYSKIQTIVAGELPYISLWHLNNVSVVHRRVKNYRQHPMAGFFSFKDIRVE
ncbi:MAG: ABC transporter substrate-binding protein [Desulfobacteraceae bacterium]|nr:ABC transporter substrate-binding protein [Desulfobacteraceae bacterium]